jgi:glycosyltransferase involved in cell wall biosynthesis
MALNNQYSVIIAVKNGEQFIKNSIESILTQTLPPFEIIVVNDHSIDSTTSLVSKEFPEVSIINSSFDGQARAIVVGLEKVKTPYVALLDSDDIWEPTKQEIQINVLNEKPELSVVCSGVRNFLSNPSEKTDVSLNAKLFHQSRQFSACTFHTEVLRSEVPLDLEKKHFEWQMNWWSRFENKQLKSQQTNQIHLNRRIHQQNSWNQNFEEGASQLMSFLREHKKNQQ